MKAHRVLKVDMRGPDDVDAVDRVLSEEGFAPDAVRALMCMTEGDGLARGFASLAFSEYFQRKLGWDINEVPERIPMLMIGGCAGLVVPYAAVFVEDPGCDRETSGEKGLAIGITTTPTISIEEFGTVAMVRAVAEAVEAAMNEADLSADDVHNVQIKAPWPLEPSLVAARAEGKTVATVSGDRAGALARGAGALGVAAALGEIDLSQLTDDDIASNWDFRTNIGSASAGTERRNVAVIVMGNSPTSASPFQIGHGVLADGIDASAVHSVLDSLSLEADPRTGEVEALDHAFVKSAVELTGSVRGHRHVLQTDYLGPYAWLTAKAVIHATVSAVLGTPVMQVSGGGEHQGPPGGGLLAVIRRR